ncbi:MAG: endonuclease domain-containing protein [Bacteroidota bacterium]|jgi:very-short-patch-repair endonuclease
MSIGTGVVEKAMAEHYNKSIMKQRRKALRKNLSKAEAIMWNHLSRRQMNGYKFRRQHSVEQYVIDIYCPELELAIEIDGDSHFMPGAEEQDKARQEYIESFGIQFLRFTNEDVYKNIDGVCKTVFNKIREIKMMEMKS